MHLPLHTMYDIIGVCINTLILDPQLSQTHFESKIDNLLPAVSLSIFVVDKPLIKNTLNILQK